MRKMIKIRDTTHHLSTQVLRDVLYPRYPLTLTCGEGKQKQKADAFVDELVKNHKTDI